ncbi:hypothetical protein ACWGJ9_11700 [Curtobacterium citreum]
MPAPKRARFHIGPTGPEACPSGCPRGWEDEQHYRSHHAAQTAFEADPAAYPPMFPAEAPPREQRTWDEILASDQFESSVRSYLLTELYQGQRTSKSTIASVRPDLAFDHVVEQFVAVASADLQSLMDARQRLAEELQYGTDWKFADDAIETLRNVSQRYRSDGTLDAYTRWYDEHAAEEPEVVAETHRRALRMVRRSSFLSALLGGARVPDAAARAFEQRWAAGNPHKWSHEGVLHQIRGVEQQLARLARHAVPDQAANEMGFADAAAAFDDLQARRRRLMLTVTQRGRGVFDVADVVARETGVFDDAK